MDNPDKPAIFIATGDAESNGFYGSAALHMYAEYQEIVELLEPSAHANKLDLLAGLRATKKKLAQAFSQHAHAITVFHFAGHADGQSLFLCEDSDGAPIFNISRLAAFLAEQPNLQLVFLNACSTDTDLLWDRLRRAGIPLLIATTDEVDDQAAKLFAVEFYRTLLNRHTVGAAFQIAGAIAAQHASHPPPDLWRLYPRRKTEVRERTFWDHICRLPDEKNGPVISQMAGSLTDTAKYGEIMPPDAVTPPPEDETRSREVAELVRMLLATDRRGIILYGDQNSGKTVLARRVLSHPGLQDPVHGFPWRFEVALDSQITDLSGLLKRLLEQCRFAFGGHVNVEQVADRQLAGMLKAAVAGSRSLLLACNLHDSHGKLLAQLQQEMPRMLVLATTPVHEVALKLERDYQLYEVGPLEEDDAVKLLMATLKGDTDQGARTRNWQDPALAKEIVHMLGRKPALILSAGHAIRTGKITEQANWQNELKELRLRGAVGGVTTNDRAVVASYVAELSAEQRFEFCGLSAFAPWPASFLATPEQRALVAIGALKPVAGGRYQIVESYHRYAADLAEQQLRERERILMQRKHAEQYAEVAAAVFGRGMHDHYDYPGFEADWPNIDRGWRWALRQWQLGEAPPESGELLVKFASCVFFMHPTPLAPEEKLARLKAARAARSHEQGAGDPGEAQLAISLAEAHIEVAEVQRKSGNLHAAHMHVREAKQLIDPLQRSSPAKSIEQCALHILAGDIARLDVPERRKAGEGEDTADDFYLEAEYLAGKLRQRHYECLALYRRAGFYAGQGQPRPAIGLYAHALTIALDIAETRMVIAALCGLGDSTQHLAQRLSKKNPNDPDILRMQDIEHACRRQQQQLSYSLL
jgi:hypothetical protein